MIDELDRHAGKAPEEQHPVEEGAGPDPSDHADPRVAQPGEDPPGEDARSPSPRDTPPGG
jgi:hypothetical protein